MAKFWILEESERRQPFFLNPVWQSITDKFWLQKEPDEITADSNKNWSLCNWWVFGILFPCSAVIPLLQIFYRGNEIFCQDSIFSVPEHGRNGFITVLFVNFSIRIYSYVFFIKTMHLSILKLCTDITRLFRCIALVSMVLRMLITLFVRYICLHNISWVIMIVSNNDQYLCQRQNYKQNYVITWLQLHNF